MPMCRSIDHGPAPKAYGLWWICSVGAYWGIALFVVGAFVFCSFLPEATIRLMMRMGLMGCTLLYAVRLFWKQKFEPQVFACWIVFLALVMRVGYTLYTPCAIRGHDINGFDDVGHMGYTFRLFSQWQLPPSNAGQFYHPPFQHILQALVAKVAAGLHPDMPMVLVFEYIRIIPCFAMCCIPLVGFRIAREAGLSFYGQAMVLVLLAFMPGFYVMAANVNNDALMVLFYLISCLYTLRWYKCPTLKNILITAVCIGCGMMTKISGGMVALVTALAFLAVLIKGIRQGWWKKLTGQFLAFLGVCCPLALWYPLRNWLLFGQKLQYVLDLGKGSSLYIGNHSLAERLGFFSLPELLERVFCYPYEDVNLWQYLVSCSVFGEYQFPGMNRSMACVLLLSNLVLILLSLAAMVYALTDKGHSLPVRVGLLLVWGSQVGSFILFNLRYPFGCTMDFRYLVPACVAGILGLAMGMDSLAGRLPRAGRYITAGAWGCIISFAVFGCLCYVL